MPGSSGDKSRVCSEVEQIGWKGKKNKKRKKKKAVARALTVENPKRNKSDTVDGAGKDHPRSLKQTSGGLGQDGELGEVEYARIRYWTVLAMACVCHVCHYHPYRGHVSSPMHLIIVSILCHPRQEDEWPFDDYS